METVILSAALLLLAVALVLVRRQRAAAGRVGGSEELAAQVARLRAEYPTPADRKACDRIEAELRSVSRGFSLQTSVAPRKVYTRAFDLVRAIAAIYYPESETPELRASVADLLQLNGRIVARLKRKLEEFPLNTVKDLDIENILKGKSFYESRIKNKLEWLQKFKRLYNLGSRAWLGYNVLNPWYWGRRLVYTSAREITFRSLLTWVVAIVGEEAMVVYGRRAVNRDDAALEKDTAFAMIDLAVGAPRVSREAYAAVLDYVLNAARLSDATRVTLLRALAAGRPLGGGGPLYPYSAEQRQRLLADAQRVLAGDAPASGDQSARLAALERALATGAEER